MIEEDSLYELSDGFIASIGEDGWDEPDETPSVPLPLDKIEKGDVINNRYLVAKKLGTGATGEVLHCFDLQQRNKIVAVKRLSIADENKKKRFLREFRILNEVQHSSLINAYDFFEDSKGVYMVLEYVAGLSMAKLLEKRSRKLSIPDQLVIANKVSRGIEILNTGGILHRDIKPANIMINFQTGSVKVIDLGVGKNLNIVQSDLTYGDGVVGTLPYLSPEQTKGKHSETSDVFSLGVTFYQFFLWRRNSPFFENNPYAILCKVEEYNPPTIYEEVEKAYQSRGRQLTKKECQACTDLSNLIAKAMEKNPENRCSARDMANELARIYRSFMSIELYKTSPINKKLHNLSGDLTPTLKNNLMKIRRRSREMATTHSSWMQTTVYGIIIALFFAIWIALSYYFAG